MTPRSFRVDPQNLGLPIVLLGEFDCQWVWPRAEFLSTCPVGAPAQMPSVILVQLSMTSLETKLH